MKTQLILLAISATAANLFAVTPVVQLKKSPITAPSNYRPAVSMPRQLMQSPAPAAKPSVRVSPSLSLTNKVANQPANPKIIGSPLIKDNRVKGITGGQGAAMRQGFEAANAVRDFNTLRNALPEGLRQNAITGNTPKGPGKPNLDIGSDGGFAGREIRNPLDRSSNGKPRDLRGEVRKGRRAGDWDTDGGWNTGPHEYMSPDGSRHTVAGTDRQSSTRHYSPTGKYVGSTEESWNRTATHVTAQHFDSEGRHTSTVLVETQPNGVEQKTVYREGQAPVITRSDDPAPAKTGAQTCDRDPSEGASLGGASGPKLGDAIGLKPIDLLRQYAEGEQTVHRVAPRTREQMNGNQVCPVGESGRTQGPGRVTRINTLHPTGGGDTLDGGNDRPD